MTMKRAGVLCSIAIALVSLSACRTVTEATTVPDTVTAVQENTGLITLENAAVKLVIDPKHGGSVVSFIHKPLGKDVVPPGRPDQMGLFLDHYWEDGWRWPGELMEAPYEVKELVSNPEEAVVLFRHPIAGKYQNFSDPRVSGLVLEKRMSLKAGSDAVLCRTTLSNPTEATKLVAFWEQQYFFAGGDYDEAADVFSRPSSRGVRRSGKAAGNLSDFLADPVAGWSAATDTGKGSGLVWLFDYNYLNKPYNSGGNVTLEWLYDTVMIPPGKSWGTEMAMVPFMGLHSIIHASPNLIAGYEVKRNGTAMTITHYLRQGIHPVRDVEIAVELEGLIDSGKLSAQPIHAGRLGAAASSFSQEFAQAPKDPFIIRAKVKGRVEGSGQEFQEEYWDFYCGGYGYGDNVQQDMTTPLYKVQSPPKHQVMMKPDNIARIREPSPRYFLMAGLAAGRFGLEAVCGSTAKGPEPAKACDRATYSISTFGQGAKLSDFPLDYDRIMRYDALIAANVNMDCAGLLGREMLQDYLAHGGGLLVLGGKAAYGTGAWRGTPLEEFLPVVLDKKDFDIEKVPAGALRMGEPDAITEGLDLTSQPRATFIHRVSLKPGAKVLLYAGDQPFLVAWQKGESRVACVLGTPYGAEETGGGPLFFGWADWPRLMSRTLLWLGERP